MTYIPFQIVFLSSTAASKAAAAESCFQQAKSAWEGAEGGKPSFIQSNAQLGLELFQWQAQRMWFVPAYFHLSFKPNRLFPQEN